MNILFIYPKCEPQSECIGDTISHSHPLFFVNCIKKAFADAKIIFAVPQNNTSIQTCLKGIKSVTCLTIPGHQPYGLTDLTSWISKHDIQRQIIWWEPHLWSCQRCFISIPSTAIIVTPSDCVWNTQLSFLQQEFVR